MPRPPYSAAFVAALLWAAPLLGQAPAGRLVKAAQAAKAANKAAKKGAVAAARPPQRLQQVDRLSKMTPEQRKKVLDALPPERRQNLERRLDAYQKMTPQQRTNIDRQLTRFEDLSPARQQTVRRLYRKFNQDIPEERRPVVRQELAHLNSMSPEDRAARMNSDEYRNKYNPGEQQLLSDLNRAFEPEHD